MRSRLLEGLLKDNTENWSEPYILLNNSHFHHGKQGFLNCLLILLSGSGWAVQLLRKARRIASKWTAILRILPSGAYNAPDKDKQTLEFIDTAFDVANSFSLYAPHVDLVMDTAEGQILLGVAMSLPATKLILLRRIINTGVGVQVSKISTVVAHDQNEGTLDRSESFQLRMEEAGLR
jgi:K+-sensing histidine kinase KdpD